MLRNLPVILILLSLTLGLFPRPAGAETLTWEDCVQEAARNNPDLIGAQETIRSSRAQVGASRSDFFPTLTPTAGYNASNSSNFRASTTSANPGLDVNVRTRQQLEVGASIQQNLFDGFKTKSGFEKSKSQLDESLANLGAVKTQVSLDLKTAFAQLLFSQEQIEVTRQIMQRREGNVRFLQLRFDVGRENQGSVLRNQALLDQARYDLSQTERALKVAQQTLAKLLGRNYEANFEDLHVKGTFKTNFPKTPPDFRTLVSENPEHQRVAAQVRTAQSDVRLAKGNLFPSLDASAAISEQKLVDSPSQNSWSAGVNLSYPFFLGGRDIYGVQSAKAEELRVQQSLLNGDNEIVRGLKQAYANFQNAVENIKVQEDFLKASETRAEIGRSQYANGLISYQDWDLVENDLINNQKTILQSLRDALIAEANWEKAQGKGAIP
jgi:outer membrane protein